MITARSDIGGGPKHVYDLVRTMKTSSAVEVFIAAPMSGEFANKFSEIADSHMEIPFRKFSIACFFSLLRYARQNQIDVIHSHGRGAGIYSRLLGCFGFKIVHTFHGAHYKENFIGMIKSLVDKILKYQTDQFICVSKDEKQKIIEYNWAWEKKINVILNGIDHDNINKKYNSLKSQNSSLVFGTLARFDYQKGIDIFLEVVKANKEYFISENIIFKIAGDGEEFVKLDSRKKAYGLDGLVEFMGVTSAPVEFLATLDVYFSFARWEGLPLAVLEAMSCPLPCILSDVVGHNELNFGGECLLFDLKTQGDFVEKVKRLLQVSDRSIMANKSFAMISKMYTLKKMTENTINVYKKMTHPG